MVHAIHPTDDSQHRTRSASRHCFTPNGATAMLPLVGRILADAAKLSQSIENQRLQLNGLYPFRETIPRNFYDDELHDIRRTIEASESRLKACHDELAMLGVVAHVPFDGSVDFPAIVNRQPVMLCWNPNDASVGYWHEAGAAVTHRHRLPVELKSKPSN
ncbi:DUF2203 domain-containing protein [Novipirellula artificiosorum]|uniref:DUF2203 domain-containing protein n=1 Tax=Novipirellula artificiosorum TaxID=2528016 RepID=A0A5C6DH68_9BACT|nr:DUF2203 family protein [Novipirellula artificiosorum]TWU34386.1 hypothetical protein Poly41_45340 [Novipirellula artificiosorum]